MNKVLFYYICFFLIFHSVVFAQVPNRIPERDAVLQTPEGPVRGKILSPATGEAPFPVVLLISGSGPTDMDGNQPGMENNSLKYLAEELAKRGIASLRFDKRGVASSAGAGKDEYSMRFDDYVKDVKLWIDYLEREKTLSDIYVAGHSEGALTGLLASENNPKVKGYISLAGAGRPAYELIEEQLAGQPDYIKAMAANINESLKAGKLVPNVPLGLQALFRSSVQPYLISWYKYDPQEEIKKLNIPVLIIQGTTDLQVPVKDAERLKAAAPQASLEIIPDINHVLKKSNGTTIEQQLDTYTQPGTPLDGQLPILIEKFVRK
ncbi:MAG: alpha/beta hydrolase [Tannerellaceae bacterium]|nr:alpha/beta hydrolase [Tannerellaceae bacterium]MCD8262915.1 alpha/beta hydrolase [Tannerellaceae bacterium]